MKRIRLSNFIQYLVPILLVLSLLAGCVSGGNGGDKTAQSDAAVDAAETDTGTPEEIELLDPVGTALSHVPVQRRDLFKVNTYQGIVSPSVTEYSYESDQAFGNYRVLPGDEVKKGDTLFYGTVDGIDEKTEEIRDANDELLAAHVAYVSDYAIDLSRAKKAEFEAASAYMNLVNNAPPEDDPGYAGFAKGLMPLENRAKQAKEAREKLEESYRERQELFDLEYAYNEKRISRLAEKAQSAGTTAEEDGIVVSEAYYFSGDMIPSGTNILAVADPEKKGVLCEYVSKSEISKAGEVYAIIDGERYEVEYEVMEPEEYRRLKQKNDEVYSTFYLTDPEGKIPYGKAAVIVVVDQGKKDALCVPKDAVNKDDSGTYVYRYENGESVYTPVQTGIVDGAFTEITYGLSEGDRVVFDAPYNVGMKTETVKKGNVSTAFDTDGFLFYPSAEWILNPARNGTAYLNEICVENYEQVAEGQTLAKVEVVTDKVEIGRLQRKIQRQNERIVDLTAERSTTYNEDELLTIDRALADRQRTIESLQRKLSKLTTYSGVFELKAPYSGIVTGLTSLKAGEILNYKEKLVQLTKDDSSFVIVEDQGGQLSYGNEVTVTYKDGTATAPKEAVGQVVSLNPTGLSKDLKLGYSLIRIPAEAMEGMTVSGSDITNGYWSRVRYTITADVKTVSNVLLVPRSAVYQSGSDTYVITKDESGDVKLVKFTAGGADNGYYWVAWGDITEGMELCLG